MEKTCEKVYFQSKKYAQVRADLINSNPDKREAHKDLYVYKCLHCDGYHLTKQKPHTENKPKTIEELYDKIRILKEEIYKQNLANYRNNLKAKIKDDLLNDFLTRYGLSDVFNAIVEVSLEFNDIEKC